MRNLDECKAEIFCRMEKGIQKRKRLRKRVLSLCLPICLLATVLSVAVITRPEQPIANASSEGSLESSNAMYVSFELTDRGGKSIASQTDPNKIDAIYGLLSAELSEQSNVSSTEDFSTSSGNFDLNGYKEHNTSATAADYHEFTFCTDSGDKTVFILDGNLLTDKATGQKMFLTKVKHAELLNALSELTN